MEKGKLVVCYIQAFDCEKTIEAAMRSVLEQTYENWFCFVLSNGNAAPNWSLDVIKRFAATDSRFVVLNKQRNDLGMYFPMLCYLASQFPDSYICSLDADDEYRKDFFERGVAMAEANRLDIVACGTEILLKKDTGSTEETLLSRREIGEDLVVAAKAYTDLFPVYKPFFNEIWGKLYRAGLFGSQCGRKHLEHLYRCRFLPDTWFTMDILSRSSSIGVLAGTCHKFYHFERRTNTNATVEVNAREANRFRNRLSNRYSAYDTYDKMITFLRSHGEISGDLYEYMQAVLFGWFGDIYARTLLGTQDEDNFACLTARLVFHPKFDEVMSYRDTGKYNNLRNFEKRKEFCEVLRNTTICQKVIGNSKCRNSTQKKLDQVARKLEDTIKILAALQKQEV